MEQDSAGITSQLAVIGGSGLYSLEEAAASSWHRVQTPYDTVPVTVFKENSSAGAVWFIARHGTDHSLAPHLINYRANLWALKELGVRAVIAVNSVGAINAALQPGTCVLPDQIIDYTWGREHTFFDDKHALDKHVDFTWPYDRDLRERLRRSALMLDLPLHFGGVYACTQGPRLETAAEIRRLRRDGCDIVGMTGMPEAALARELGLRYACVALVVNAAAGLEGDEISLDTIRAHLESGLRRVRALLLAAIPDLL